jgi:hypothetical protein
MCPSILLKLICFQNSVAQIYNMPGFLWVMIYERHSGSMQKISIESER